MQGFIFAVAQTKWDWVRTSELIDSMEFMKLIWFIKLSLNYKIDCGAAIISIYLDILTTRAVKNHKFYSIFQINLNTFKQLAASRQLKIEEKLYISPAKALCRKLLPQDQHRLIQICNQPSSFTITIVNPNRHPSKNKCF